MDLRALILKKFKKASEIRSADIVAETGFSRAYVCRFLTQLKNEGVIVQMGRANQARYVRAEKGIVLREKKKMLFI